MDKQPTQEQIKRFWEHWGFQEKFGGEWRYEEFKTTNRWWEAPNGRKYEKLPPIDLISLFKYAVPKAKLHLGQRGLRRLLQEWVERIILEEDPALALFWAIYKVMEAS